MKPLFYRETAVRNKYRRVRPVLLLLPALAGFVALVWFAERRRHRDWTRALWVRISPQQSVEVGWETKWLHQWGSRAYHYHYLVLHSPKGGKRKFFISDDEFPLTEIQLWGTVKGRPGVWVTETGTGVIATLDLQSGEFINRYRAVVDGSLSSEEQEELPRPLHDNTGPEVPKSYSKWANPVHGELLARMPR